MAGIGLDQLGDALIGLLNQYGAEVQGTIDEELAALSHDLRNEIEKASPVLSLSTNAGRKYRKRRGRYKRGWVITEPIRYGKKYRVIHNKTDWTLTHLLEKGAVRDNGNIMPTQPHMAPTFDRLLEPFWDSLKSKIGGQ